MAQRVKNYDAEMKTAKIYCVVFIVMCLIGIIVFVSYSGILTNAIPFANVDQDPPANLPNDPLVIDDPPTNDDPPSNDPSIDPPDPIIEYDSSLLLTFYSKISSFGNHRLTLTGNSFTDVYTGGANFLAKAYYNARILTNTVIDPQVTGITFKISITRPFSLLAATMDPGGEGGGGGGNYDDPSDDPPDDDPIDDSPAFIYDWGIRNIRVIINTDGGNVDRIYSTNTDHKITFNTNGPLTITAIRVYSTFHELSPLFEQLEFSVNLCSK